MCEFISWIEKDGQLYYLTYKDIFRSRRGKELRDYCENENDYTGHGAIRYYYDNFTGGKDLECTNFSMPKNFPLEIAAEIKRGTFRGLGISETLLNKAAWDEYEKINQAAEDEYEKIKQTAWAEYKKIEQTAHRGLGISETLLNKAAWDEYEKINQAAEDEYKKIEQAAFWDLFKIPKNRNPAWR